MKDKIKLLRIISTIDPNYGGPVKATIDNSIALSNNGFKVDILTCDSIKSNFYKSNKLKIINKGPAFFGNFWFSPSLFFWLLKNKKKYDFFIIHGIWDFKNLVARLLLNKKYSVFVHGSLHPAQKKGFFNRIKKQIYWKLIERRNLLSSRSILLTSSGEENQIKKTFVKTDGINKTLIQYGILKTKVDKNSALKTFYNRFPYLKNKVFYLYLGRFHEQKACDIIIQSVYRIKKGFKEKILLMGPISGSQYELYIRDLVKKYNLGNQIFFADAQYGNVKWGAIMASKAMVLPSHGENFGISLVESLSLGRPVLTTFKVNIYREILKYKVGLVSRDKTKYFSKILLKFNSFNKKKIKDFSKNSLLCFKDNFDLSSNKNSLATYIKNEVENNYSSYKN